MIRPRRRSVAACLVSAAAVTCSGVAIDLAWDTEVLLRDHFNGPDGLVTNEFATLNPGQGRASSTWRVTSGSLFRQDGQGWSGMPDRRPPGPSSLAGTNSDVFRMVSQRADLRDIEISSTFRIDRFTTDGPADAFDGLHLFTRYRSAASLLVVSVCRRDGSIAVKRKSEGGDVNGGSYTTLASAPRVCSTGKWHTARLRTVDTSDGSVALTLWLDGKQVLSAQDNVADGEPLTGVGRVGLRADNVEFHLRDIVVTPA